MYRLLRTAFFRLDAERAHYLAMNILKRLCQSSFFKAQITRLFAPKPLPVTQFGLQFKNPVGLGAGFDKNAAYLRELETLGFGFVEIGTVTPKPQGGNEQPRLYRLPKDKALLNRMGFNNDGVEAIAARLKAWRASKTKRTFSKPHAHRPLLIGGNIGKNKTTPNEDAWKDYAYCFTVLHPLVDFFVVNVSSPNTPGLRQLQEREALHQILTNLQTLNNQQLIQKPILLKIAPDLTFPQLDEVLALAHEIKLDGLVATNTTIRREGLQTEPAAVAAMGTGGLSGKPLQHPATEMVRYIVEKSGGTLPVIGSGGIFTGADAAEKKAAGACLVEVWTGFIYEGPGIVKKICKHLNP